MNTRFDQGSPSRLHGALRAFLREERGEVSPISYFLALLLAMFFVFFALDLGLRKGKRLGVEYAAFCAARAAAVILPKGEERRGGAMVNDGSERQEVRRAAAACLLAVADKGSPMPLAGSTFQSLASGSPTPVLTGEVLQLYINLFVLPKVHVYFRNPDNPDSDSEKLQYGRQDSRLLVEVQYDDSSYVPFSPLNPPRPLGPLFGPGRTMIARAEAVLQITK